jgi:mono/diheme cytochrome c family protein
MKRVALSAALKLVAANVTAVILSAGSWVAYADSSSSVSTQSSLGEVNGRQIYEHICQGCHMTEGQGAAAAGFYPKLSGNKKLVSWEFVALTVLNGRNGMPAFGVPLDRTTQALAVQLSDAQVADVVNYLRGTFGNKYPPTVTAKQVASLPHPGSAIAPF